MADQDNGSNPSSTSEVALADRLAELTLETIRTAPAKISRGLLQLSSAVLVIQNWNSENEATSQRFLEFLTKETSDDEAEAGDFAFHVLSGMLASTTVNAALSNPKNAEVLAELQAKFATIPAAAPDIVLPGKPTPTATEKAKQHVQEAAEELADYAVAHPRDAGLAIIECSRTLAGIQGFLEMHPEYKKELATWLEAIFKDEPQQMAGQMYNTAMGLQIGRAVIDTILALREKSQPGVARA